MAVFSFLRFLKFNYSNLEITIFRFLLLFCYSASRLHGARSARSMAKPMQCPALGKATVRGPDVLRNLFLFLFMLVVYKLICRYAIHVGCGRMDILKLYPSPPLRCRPGRYCLFVFALGRQPTLRKCFMGIMLSRKDSAVGFFTATYNENLMLTFLCYYPYGPK